MSNSIQSPVNDDQRRLNPPAAPPGLSSTLDSPTTPYDQANYFDHTIHLPTTFPTTASSVAPSTTDDTNPSVVQIASPSRRSSASDFPVSPTQPSRQIDHDEDIGGGSGGGMDHDSVGLIVDPDTNTRPSSSSGSKLDHGELKVDDVKNNDETNIGPPPGSLPVRFRRQSILDNAPTSSRRIQLRHGRFVPPPPLLYVPGEKKPRKVVPFPLNQIRSARYTWWNFLPLNLMQQLMRPANFYFICIAILQVIPAISISGGRPTILLPLVFVLVVSAVKDAIEDLKRSRADRDENERMYQRLTFTNSVNGQGAPIGATFENIPCKAIAVGDIIKIEDEQSFPADLYLIYSSLEQVSTVDQANNPLMDKRTSLKNQRSSALAQSATINATKIQIPSSNPNMYGGSYAYVETANLDGESNLKIKLVTEFTRDLCDEPSIVAGGHFDLRVEPTNGKLDKFGGMVVKQTIDPNTGKLDQEAPLIEQVLTLDNLLLRGSRLRNTGFIYGLAVYTGEESKIRMNSRARALAFIKRSTVERAMNQNIYIMFIAQVIFCFIGGLLAGIWQESHKNHTYLFVSTSAPLSGFQRFFTWYIIFSGFVPISLLVSLEVVKFAQGVFIGFDIGMCHYLPGVNIKKKHKTKKLASDSTLTTPKLGATVAPGSSPKGPTGSGGPTAHLGLRMTRTNSAAPNRKASDMDLLGTPKFGPASTPVGVSLDEDIGELPGELQFARAQTSGLNEELGSVGFVLSDKTGTLTCNSMDFRKSFIGKLQYGTGTTDMMQAVAAAAASSKDKAAMEAGNMVNWEETLLNIEGSKATTGNIAARFHLPLKSPHVNFNARDQILLSLQCVPPSSTAPNKPDELLWQQQRVHEYFMNLVLCNSVFPTMNEFEKVVYKASSPDEEALVEFARYVGYELLERSPPFVALSLTGPAAMVGEEEQKSEVVVDGSSSSSTTALPTPSKILEFEQLALLDFSSKRKRMSVILRGHDGRIHFFCKGADVTVLPLLSKRYGKNENLVPDWISTSDALTRFSDEGLRTLVVCSSTKPGSWWDDPENGWGQRYTKKMKALAVEGPDEEGHFKGSCKSACRRCALEEELELSAELNLIGGTAIEDKLQFAVPATIKSLLDAGIKVWVLTGDKLQTAVNIGKACNLLEAAMERNHNLLTIDGDTLSIVTDQVDRAYQHVRKLVAKEKPGGKNTDIDEDAPPLPGAPPRLLLSPEPTKLSTPVGLVLEAAAYSLIMSTVPAGEKLSPLVRKFLYVAVHCKSVVACRCQPSTKSSVVELIKTTQGVTTLAIGDGANDEQMIRAAGVGVGIRGVEGTSAVQASDYAISQFSFLRRLLFVHGHLALRRVSILICYIFYKTTLMCFCVFWFGIFSGFSGQNLVMEWAYQLYNVVFTSVPILIFAVFDRDIAPEVLEQHPDIYRISSDVKGHFFNARIFWSRWMLLSFIHSLIIFFFPYSMYQSVSVEPSGQSQGMWELGIVVYTCVVLVTNLRLALLFRSWTWLHHFALWGSIVLYFGCMLILNLSSVFGTAGGDYYGAVSRLFFHTPSFWVTVIITVGTALYFDITLEALGRFRENREQSARYSYLRKNIKPKAAYKLKSALKSSNNLVEKKKEAPAGESDSHAKSSITPIHEESKEVVEQKLINGNGRARSSSKADLTQSAVHPNSIDEDIELSPLPLLTTKTNTSVLNTVSPPTPLITPHIPKFQSPKSSSTIEALLSTPLISPTNSQIQPLIRAPFQTPTTSVTSTDSTPRTPIATSYKVPPPRAQFQSSSSSAQPAKSTSWDQPLQPHPPFTTSTTISTPTNSSHRMDESDSTSTLNAPMSSSTISRELTRSQRSASISSTPIYTASAATADLIAPVTRRPSFQIVQTIASRRTSINESGMHRDQTIYPTVAEAAAAAAANSSVPTDAVPPPLAPYPF